MINTIQGISTQALMSQIENKVINESPTSDKVFTDALSAAKSLLEATNQAESVSSQLTFDFMTGKNENIAGLMIAQEQASILLSFTMQVRNQVLTAYQEIMRMSV